MRTLGTRDVQDVIHQMRSIAQAYPEDIFPPLTEAEVKGHSAIVSRASASMGRHFAKILKGMADDLERVTSGTSDAVTQEKT